MTNPSTDNLESFIHLNYQTYSFAINEEQKIIETSLEVLNNSKFNLTLNIILCSLNVEIKKDKLYGVVSSLIVGFDSLIEDKLNDEYVEKFMVHDLGSLKIIEIEMVSFEDGEFYHLTILISVVGERLQNTNILSNEKRRKIFEYIQSNPGAYLREIMRENGLSPNWTKYHLNVLETYGYIRSKRCGRNIVYFPEDKKIDDNVVEAHIVLHNKNIKKMLNVIIFNPGISSRELRNLTNLHRNTIRNNLDKLLRAGIIKEVYERGKTRIYLSKI